MLKNKNNLWIGLLLAVVVGFTGGLLTQSWYRQAKITNNFVVYGTDTQAEKIEKDLYISFNSQLNQTQKLEKLSNLLSRYQFCGLPIEIKSTENGIVTINLDEHPWVKTVNTPPTLPGCSGQSWRFGYFQGSAGGYVTTVTLTRTFLQPDYQGNWIKGIQFYYGGQPIKEGDWDHINLDGVITRENLPYSK